MNFCLPAGFEESAVLPTIPRGLLASSGVCLHSSHAALPARIHHDLYCPPQVRITFWKPFSNWVILIQEKKVIYFGWYCHLGECNSASYWYFENWVLWLLSLWLFPHGWLWRKDGLWWCLQMLAQFITTLQCCQTGWVHLKKKHIN